MNAHTAPQGAFLLAQGHQIQAMGKRLSHYSCAHCNAEFEASGGAKYCGLICRLKHHSAEQQDGCIVWQKSKFPDGYGKTHRDGKYVRTHRAAYDVFVGPIPEGQSVCHTCDNRACINPAHLFLGSPAENSADMARKGRSLQGVRHHKAKLTEADVLAIRADKRSGRAIGAEYGVTDTQVYLIKNRKTWKHLP